MGPDGRRQTAAVTLALLSALLWATYYFFVYALTPGATPSAVFAYPFLFGGGAYVLWAAGRGHGRAVVRLFGDPSAWFRTGLLVGMQLAVLAATYTAGAVDTSLLSLVGDVVMTPLLVMWLFREGRERARSPVFASGVVLATGGASLTIVAGGTIVPLTGASWLVAPLVPLLVAAFFLASAHASQKTPTDAVVGQAFFLSGLVGLAISPVLPGGIGGLVVPSPAAIGLLTALGVTSFFVAPALWFAAVGRSGLILPALLMAAIPVFTLGLSFLLIHLVPPVLGLVGIPVAVVGAFLAAQGTHRPWNPNYVTAASEAAP